MRLTIFGAAGRTGGHLVRLALEAGHEVVAFARDPGKLDHEHDRLRVVRGDVLDAGKVAEAVSGAEAAISVLAPPNNRPEFVASRGMGNILAAMKEAGVRRLVVTAGAGVRDPEDRPTPLSRVIGVLLKLLSRNVYEDMVAVVEQVKASDLDWTVVRVPMLTDAPPAGGVRVGYVGRGIGARLSRADLADFLLKEVAAAEYLHQSPVIST